MRAVFCWLLFWFLWLNPVQAGPLLDRLATFPEWQTKPLVQPAEGDLIYPAWFAGTWTMTSTLVDLVAPLAPDVVTPGFDRNQQYLNQPITCQVRFVRASSLPGEFSASPLNLPLKALNNDPLVSDRAFNGLNLARAYLGNRAVLSVEVDPTAPNRQITTFREGRQLVSVVTGRAVEEVGSDRFITTELFQQIFRGTPQPYLNQVETTTDYHLLSGQKRAIVADQVTAIYLSPQDPEYFKAVNKPVALYRYRLEFSGSPSLPVKE
ncbi:MAG: hypothetical protein K6T90_11450 [Leptolyngbyaceae cyanobacterium HOT.MB2.61]|nr:hypothetical protein [Leptolyngbyaceae cyanobacterium HOT.MB2.61]